MSRPAPLKVFVHFSDVSISRRLFNHAFSLAARSLNYTILQNEFFCFQ